MSVTGSALIQAKPSPEQTMTYCQFDTEEQIPVKCEFSFKKMRLKMSPVKRRPFSQEGMSQDVIF